MGNTQPQGNPRWTPDFVHRTLLSGLDRLNTALSNFSPVILALVISALYVSFYFNVAMDTRLVGNEASFFEARYFWIVPLTVPFVLLGDVIMSLFKIKPFNKLLVLFAILFIVLPEITSVGSIAFWPWLVRFSLVFVLGTHVLVLIATRELNIILRLILFFLLEAGIILFLRSMALANFFGESFWITQPYRYIFLFTLLAAEMKDQRPMAILDRKFMSYIFNPINFITPLPIHYRDWFPTEPADPKLRAKGALYLMLGFISLCFTVLLMVLRKQYYYHGIGLPFRWFPGGALNYLYYFTFSYANITIPVSLAWWMGFRLPDCYDVPLLATSPQARWRRWNFYFYEWYFRFFFFPAFKKTQSQVLAVTLAFLATVFVHLGPHNSEFFFPLNETLSGALLRKFYFFFLHGLIVYLGIKLNKWIPGPERLSGWIAVLCMFIIMSAVHWVALL